MPCAANTPSDDVVERFRLFDETNHVNCAPDTTIRHSLTATKLITHHLPNQVLDINASEGQLTSKGDLWSSLKAVPLASYYKLHRVPSFASMTDSGSDDMDTIQLPRRESTVEPQERMPQNGIRNKVLEQVVRTPGREPSPQPTHLAVPGSSQHKVLHEEGSGYVAPKFEGKEAQMDQGMFV